VSVGDGDESVIRDGDTVGVAREVVQHMRGTAKQRQRILPIVTEKKLSSITRIIL
jgi:hypothetical protein